MKESGTVLAVAGVLGFLAALFIMPTSVSADAIGGEVVNLDLQQRQLLVAIGSAALFVGGVILHAVGSLAERMPRRAQAPEAVNSDDAATMRRLGIVHQGRDFIYGGFAYGSLAAAIAAAERSAR